MALVSIHEVTEVEFKEDYVLRNEEGGVVYRKTTLVIKDFINDKLEIDLFTSRGEPIKIING